MDRARTLACRAAACEVCCSGVRRKNSNASTRLAAAMQDCVVAPRSPLDVIASALARASVVVGLDTGLTHLAAALGRPTVGIYCDYDPRLVGLVGDGPVRSLGGVTQQPTVDDVIAATATVLGDGR